MATTTPTKRTAGKGMRFVITGVKEIDRKLKQLEPRIAKKVVRKSMREALRLVRAAVQSEQKSGPFATGATAKAVKIQAGRNRRRGTITVEVRIGVGDYVGDQFYAAFVEFGTKRMEARHKMEAAFDRTKNQARDTAVKLMLAGADREIRSLGSGGK
jgi:HK97 gp10 family phage protein